MKLHREPGSGHCIAKLMREASRQLAKQPDSLGLLHRLPQPIEFLGELRCRDDQVVVAWAERRGVLLSETRQQRLPPAVAALFERVARCCEPAALRSR